MPAAYALPLPQATVDDLALANGRRGRRARRPRPATGPRFRPPAAGERARAPPRTLRRFRAGRRRRRESRYDSRRRCGRSPSSAWRACALHLVSGTGKHAPAVAAAAARHGLALEVHVDEASWTRLEPVVASAGERLVVVDHLGRPDDPRSRSAREMLRVLAGHPNVVVKLAALDVVSRTPFPHDGRSAADRRRGRRVRPRPSDVGIQLPLVAAARTTAPACESSRDSASQTTPTRRSWERPPAACSSPIGAGRWS